jgi:hypothetical protein
MEDRPERLSYARPMTPDRPAMYSLVLTVLAATFLIALGCALVVGALMAATQTFSLALFLLMLVGFLFFWVGIRSMMQTVHFLRGGRREGNWRQWMFDLPAARDSDDQHY